MTIENQNEAAKIVAAAIKIVTADHRQYQDADTQGRANIRRNIAETMRSMGVAGTPEAMAKDYADHMRRQFDY